MVEYIEVGAKFARYLAIHFISGCEFSKSTLALYHTPFLCNSHENSILGRVCNVSREI